MKHTPSNETVVPGNDLWGAAAHGAAAAASAPRRNRRRRGLGARAALAVVPLAVLASGAMVYQASNAAFTATTGTPTNNWTAGTVTLTDNDGNAALFNVSGIKPGDANGGSACINVTYGGNLRSNVKMYVKPADVTDTPGANGGSLGNKLLISVEEGTGATNTACAGFASLGTPKWLNTGAAAGEKFNSFIAGDASYTGNYESTAGYWDTNAATVRSFKITWWLPDLTDPDNQAADQTDLDSVQGSQLAAKLTWEARNV